MSSVSITTTQNVTIDYTLADFKLRALAFSIDVSIIGAWISVHYIINTFAFGSTSFYNVYFYLMVIPFFSFYTLLLEYYMNGQTLGKRSMNIKVVMINGREPTFIDYFIRWSRGFIEIYLSSGVLATIMINTTNHNQRLADIIAGTIIIKIDEPNKLTADDLLKIKANNNFKPSYPEVLMFTESELVTIKKLTDRYRHYNNEAYKKLINDCAIQLALKMGVTIKESKPEFFLKTLIHDYVVLTR